jgi:hypothetical protein
MTREEFIAKQDAKFQARKLILDSGGTVPVKTLSGEQNLTVQELATFLRWEVKGQMCDKDSVSYALDIFEAHQEGKREHVVHGSSFQYGTNKGGCLTATIVTLDA